MSKVKRRVLSLLFVALMVLIAACGNSGDNSSNTAGSSSTDSSSASSKTESSPSAEVSSNEKVELTISAAASLNEALTDVQKAYANVAPNVTLNFNLGASGALQQQIEQGAPADLFLSAAMNNMKALVDRELIDADKSKTFLKNELVAVVSADSMAQIVSVSDLTSDVVKFVAVGIPESVPAGKYAQESLLQTGLWDLLQSKMVQGKDVKQVLQYVETGNADVGFVYKTDALVSEKVKVAFAVDPATYTEIEYPIGIVKSTNNLEAAQAFYDYLQSEEALKIFFQYGFSASAE